MLVSATACSGGEPDPTTTAPSPTPTPSTSVPVAEPAQPVPEDCGTVTLEVGEVLDGEQLASCLQAAQTSAGTGTMATADDGDHWTTFEFEGYPEPTAYSPEEFGMAFYLTPDGDWMNVLGEGWQPADGGVVDTMHLLLSRLDPAWTSHDDWEVVDFAEVPTDQKPFVEAAWRLTSDEGGHELWIDPSFLPAYTLSPGDVQVETVVQDWGGEVDLPDFG